MRGGVLTGRVSSVKRCLERSIRIRESLAEPLEIKLEQVGAVVLTRTPMGALVRWVAGIRASVHTKLMVAFMIVTLLFVAMGAFSVRTILETAEQTRQLEQAHQRVAWSQQIEQARGAPDALLGAGAAVAGRSVDSEDPAREQPLQRDAGQARRCRPARAARPCRTGPGRSGRGHGRGGRHGQCHPRPEPGRLHPRAARPTGAHRR